MITDARVFREDFIPGDIVHRHSEISRLSTALEPLMVGEPGETSFLFGPTGAGKTCSARYTTEELQRQHLDVETKYINCWDDNTRFAVLYRLLEGIGQVVDVHRRSTPKDELLHRLRDRIEKPYVVVLDEVDQLHDKSLLYDLYSLPELTPILISNREEELFVDMDDRVTSRLRASERIQFSPYSTDEIVSILEERVRLGLNPYYFRDEHLERIAGVANGDARVAIAVLRATARIFRQSEDHQLPMDIIERAVPKAEEELRNRVMSKLTRDQRILFEIVEDEGVISPGELYSRYVDLVEDPKTQRTIRNYMTKLEHYNLIKSEGQKRGRRYMMVEGRS